MHDLVRPRQRWMDLLRGIAILLVINLHALSPLDDDGRHPPDLLLRLNEALAPYRIPTLVFLSGMLLQGSLRKGFRRFTIGKLQKIGWPYLVWSAVFLVVVGAVSSYNVGKVFYDPPTYLWYLFFLLAFYFMAYALLTFAKAVPTPAVAVVSLAVSAVMPEDGRSQRFFFLFAFFLLGDWAARHPVRWRAWVTHPAAVVLGASFAISGAMLSFDLRLVRYQSLYAWCVLGWIIVACRFTPAVTRFAISKPLEFMGRQSLIFYCVHMPALLTAAKLLRRAGFDGAPVLVPAAVVAGVGAGCFFYFVQRLVPLVGWLFAFPTRRAPVDPYVGSSAVQGRVPAVSGPAKAH
jgi:fucose 4-O-acetylase-like acetyltransferase